MSPELEIGRWTADDDLVDAAGRSGRTRVRVAIPRDVSVVLGSGGRPERELHVAACVADRVAVLRRRGGGCAVVLDPGNVVVSVARPLSGLGGARAHFAAASRWLARALEGLGYAGVEQRGTSDLAHGERKVGGSCIYRRKGLIYYSTTLLVAPRVGLIERYLPHPPREPDYRRRRTHREFLVALPEIGPAVAPDGLAGRLRDRLTPRSFDDAVLGR